MAQAQSPETFVNGQQVTASRLNNHVNGLLLLPGAITDQSALTANTLATGDEFLINDLTANALRRVTADSILNSGLSITTGSVTGNAGADITVTPAATYKLNVAGNLAATGTLAVTGASTLTGNVTASADATVVGKLSLSSTAAMKLPVGTTAQRPGSPVQGDIRFNTTTTQTEVYNGTAWEEVGGGPFDATGGNTIIAPDTTVVSGVSFTSADGYRVTVTHSGHSVHPGQTIKFTTTVAGYSGEFTVYEANATTFKFFMVTVATPNSGTGSYQKAGNFKCHIFTSSGTFVAGNKAGYVEVLVVGGGGGGSNYQEGGGAGGIAYVGRYLVNAGAIVSVTVGAGGAAGLPGGAPWSHGQNGGSSIFGSITAYGGNGALSNSTPGSSGYTSIDPTVYPGYGNSGGGARGSAFETLTLCISFGVFSSITGIEQAFGFGGASWGSTIKNPPVSTQLYWPNNSGNGGNANAAGNSGIVIVRYPYWL